MALTENQKQILGMMTDERKLYGESRIACKSDDVLALSQIAIYIAQAIPAKQAQLVNMQALIAQLQSDLVILQGES